MARAARRRLAPAPAAAPSAREVSIRISLPTISVVERFCPSRLSSHSAFAGVLRCTRAALLQILLSDFGEFSPENDAMPFGALLAFAVAVFES